LFEIIDYTS
jgi:hypothetical protein